MKQIYRKIGLAVTVALLGGTSLFGQELKEPNYILRHKDFVARRAHDSSLNFARKYYQATAPLMASLQAKKANEEWTPIGPFGKEDLAGTGRINSMTFHPTDSATWYICVAQGGVWKTTNSGASWTSISGNLPILRTSSLAINPNNTDIMYVAVGDFAYLGHNLMANENKRNTHYGLGIYKTTDGGSSWQPTSLSFMQTDFEGSLIAKILLHPSDPDKILAIGETGAYLSDDAGNSWQQTDSRLIWDVEQDPQEPNKLVASTGYVYSYRSGEAGVIYSEDFGLTWQNASINVPKQLDVQRIELAYAPSDNQFVYAIACDSLGGFYGFYKSIDGGKNYTQTISNSYPYNLLAGEFDTTKGGQGRYDLAICVDRNDKNHVVIGGINMWQTHNGGVSFAPVTYWRLNYYKLSMHADIHEIRQQPGGTGYFACHDGGLSRSFQLFDEDPDAMKSFVIQTKWENYTEGLNISSFYRLSVNEANPSQKIAGAQDNSTVLADGTTFSNLSGGDGMESEFMEEVDFWYTSSQNGAIYAFRIFAGNATYEGPIQKPNGERGEWTTPMMSANGYLYVLYENLYSFSGQFQSGVHSNFQDPGDGIPRLGTALDVYYQNGRRIYLAKRGYASLGIQNQVMTTDDGGQVWSDISNGIPRNQYPAYIEMSQLKPEEVWACFSGFDSLNKVYYSADAGANWKNITFDLPNIPVNCIVHQEDGRGTVYVGTDNGVYYLKKDSIHWVYYSEGLPKVIVSELEIDTASRTLVAATFGRGLWEVGLVDFDSTFGTSTGPLANIHPLKVYPNPSTVYVDLDGEIPSGLADLQLKVVDVSGRIVVEKSIPSSNGKLHYRLDVKSWLSGEYFVVLTSGNYRQTARFVKE